MHRFYLPSAGTNSGRTLELTDREAHHASHVLRVRKGEEIVVLNGAGLELNCAVSSTSKSTVTLDVLNLHQVPPLPWSITLAQAIPKGKIIDSIIQKATELGVTEVVPLTSERVVSQLDAESGSHKADKWQQVAIEAIKQSGNAWLPTVSEPVTPQQFITRHGEFDLVAIGSLRGDARHPREHIDAYVQKNGRAPRKVCLWIGPEGDFTGAELDAAEAAGALPITLGRTVLRSETAATYVMSIFSYELQWHFRS